MQNLIQSGLQVELGRVESILGHWPPSGITLEKKNGKGMSHTPLIFVFLMGFGLLYLQL